MINGSVRWFGWKTTNQKITSTGTRAGGGQDQQRVWPELPTAEPQGSSPLARLWKISLSLHSWTPWQLQTIMAPSTAGWGTMRHSLEVTFSSRPGSTPSRGRLGWWHRVCTVMESLVFLLEEQKVQMVYISDTEVV